jgi:2'-5' RNA ligase
VRAFIAVFPPDEAVDHLAAALQAARLKASDSLRWQEPSRWHITLAFLGAVHRPDQVAERLQTECRDRSSVARLAIAGAGRFGGVLWMGIDADQAARRLLDQLARAARRAARAAGAHVDRARFAPHLTVARTRSTQPVELVHELGAYRGPAWPVRDVCLVESILGPAPRYEIVERIPLRSAELDG